MGVLITEKATGRPLTEIDFAELKALMAFYPTLQEVASWFNCSEDTIERRVHEESGMTFKDFRELKAGKTRLLLKRKAIAKALEEDNEKMLIYCLRTMTDMDDREDQAKINPGFCEIKLSYSDKDL